MKAAPDFDAEEYLRRLSADRLDGDCVADDRVAIDHPLDQAARALVAVGLVSANVAQDVVNEHWAAVAEHRETRRTRVRRPAAGRAFQPQRVVLCNRPVEQSRGVAWIRAVRLGEEGTTMDVRVDGGPAPEMSWDDSPAVHLADDRGNRTTARLYSSAGADDGWHGQYGGGPLAGNASWIEFDGDRLRLADRPLGATITVEAVRDGDPALHYLWHVVAAREASVAIDRGPPPVLRPPGFESGVEAFIAAGLIAADSPDLVRLRAVITGRTWAKVDHQLAAGLISPDAPAAQWRRAALDEQAAGAPPDPLPSPWGEVLDRAPRPVGPTGIVSLRVLTPAFDGVRLAVCALESTGSEFTVETEVTPGILFDPWEEDTVNLPSLAWWATDDAGNTYLGKPGGGGGSEQHHQGAVVFDCPLDPAATRLTLIPTTNRARALIEIPLDWASRST